MAQSVVRARSEVEAAWLLVEGRDGARLIAGGTEMMLRMQRGARPGALVDIRRAGMHDIRPTKAAFRLGSTTPVAALLTHGDVKRTLPVLHAAAARLGSPAIRTLATVGGNLPTNNGMGNLAVALVALDASVLIRRGDERRHLPIQELYGPAGLVHLDDKDLITEVLVPLPSPSWTHQRFARAAGRAANVHAAVNLAMVLRREQDVVTHVRIAVGGVALCVTRAHDAEAVLTGQPLTRDRVAEAADALLREARPPPSVGASGAYRREAARRMLGRMLLECAL